MLGTTPHFSNYLSIKHMNIFSFSFSHIFANIFSLVNRTRHRGICHFLQEQLPKRNLSPKEKLIHAFITSRLDYCSSLLYGVPDYHLQKLQRVMNAASARLIFCAPKHCHITPLLLRLHWLPIRLRIELKILLITYKVLQGSAPQYLIDLISVLLPSHYDLRQNNTGILLSTPKTFQRVTMGD